MRSLRLVLVVVSLASVATAQTTPSPMERALACHGDNPCIVNALGNATAEPELAMLAVTYRLMGDRSKTVATMCRYLARYPNGARAASFRSYTNGTCP